MSEIPAYEILKKMAEEKLGKILSGDCLIKLVKGYDEETLQIIKEIDHEKFREELWYSDNEIQERMNMPGFLCFLVYLNEKPIAFEYGYDVSEGVYFSDSQATLIEGKGVGTTQFALEILYLYHRGYKKIKLTTEEKDTEGRELSLLWSRMGFEVVGEEDGTISMEMDLTDETALFQYEKYLKSK